ncbi:MAG TPA: hypothetical protein VHL09_13965 [Dehalococcoidia bacterium]|nr:hypothetical protein [Dehalococcoidia bacterium]
MPSDPNVLDLLVQVDAGDDASPEEIDRLTRRLLAQIRELDVESARLARAEEGVPEGAKLAEAIALGSLAVQILPAVAPKLVEFLQAWTLRGHGRTVKIKTQQGDKSVEVEFSPSAMSPEDLKKYVDVLTPASPNTGSQD